MKGYETMSIDKKTVKEVPVKSSYNIPKIKYIKQKKSSGKSAISLGKIMRSYWEYLKKLEKFSKTHGSDYAVKMAISYLKIKKHKNFLKKCYNEYKLNKSDANKVKGIALKFMGSAGAPNNGTFINFFQAIMRIQSPLVVIDKVLKRDKDLLKDILSGEATMQKKTRDTLLGAQNEFFKFADKSKISDELDQEFFANFNNLYKLSKDIPDVVDTSIGFLSEDLNCVAKGNFKLGLTDKIKSKVDKNIGPGEEKTFVRMFVNKIEGFEDTVEKLLKDNEISIESLSPEVSRKFNMDEPQVSYKKLITFKQCLKFLNIDAKGNEGQGQSRMEKYFGDVQDYADKILELKGIKQTEKKKIINSIMSVRKNYESFVSEVKKKLH